MKDTARLVAFNSSGLRAYSCICNLSLPAAFTTRRLVRPVTTAAVGIRLQFLVLQHGLDVI